jgi:hypothetical protein
MYQRLSQFLKEQENQHGVGARVACKAEAVPLEGPLFGLARRRESVPAHSPLRSGQPGGIVAARGHAYHWQPGSLKLPIRVCQPRAEDT